MTSLVRTNPFSSDGLILLLRVAYAWGILVGVLLVGAGLLGVYRPTIYRLGPFDYTDIEDSTAFSVHRQRQATGAVILGAILFVTSLFL